MLDTRSEIIERDRSRVMKALNIAVVILALLIGFI